jgi:hypothetical protein
MMGLEQRDEASGVGGEERRRVAGYLVVTVS